MPSKRHQHFIDCEELTKTVGGLAIFVKFENKPDGSQFICCFPLISGAFGIEPYC
jgi:hypothetical protein